MKKQVWVGLILFMSFAVGAKSNSKQFDALLNELFEADGPGGVALVVKDGKQIYKKAFGMADLELDVDMEADHIFRIGSITKQFTAVAILQLVESGKLNLDDEITAFIADYPTHGHKITVKHLLNHTSGIKSYTALSKWTSEARKRDFTLIDLIDYFKNEPMDFAPGEQFMYNNSGYVLLGHIIEVASGETYADYIQNHIFKPLKMTKSSYGSTSRIIKNRAKGYDQAEGEYKNADFLSMTQPHAAGSLLSTVDDLNTWYQAVLNDELISAQSRVQAHTMGVLNNKDTIDYGYGWFLGNIQGESLIEHGGGINGYLSASLVLPEEGVFVAVLSNCNCNAPSDVSKKMAAIAIDKPFNWKKTSLDVDLLKSYQGVYEKTAEDVRTFTYEDGQLYSLRTGGARNLIHPFSKDEFYFEDSILSLNFNRNDQGELESVTLKSTGQDQIWVKTDKPIPVSTAVSMDTETFSKFIGKYQLAPDFYINIFSEDGIMYTQATGQQKIELVATADNKFTLKNTDIKLTMNSNAEGEVESLTLHQNGNHPAKKVE